MPGFLNRTTKQYVPRGNTPDFPVEDWIKHPDMTAVEQSPGIFVPDRYWIITGDIVTLMDQAARDAEDAALADEQKLGYRVEAASAPEDRNSGRGFEVRAIIEQFNRRDNFNTSRILELQAVVLAMLESSGNTAAMRTAGLAVLAGNTPPDEFTSTQTRSRAMAIQAYKDDINSGAVDTAGGA
jgi:hypothetical protein